MFIMDCETFDILGRWEIDRGSQNQWLRNAAQTFEPEKTVHLKNGDTLTYDYLVVCTGVKLDWGKVAGLAETLGKNGVCSNYSPEHVTYTWIVCSG